MKTEETFGWNESLHLLWKMRLQFYFVMVKWILWIYQTMDKNKTPEHNDNKLNILK